MEIFFPIYPHRKKALKLSLLSRRKTKNFQLSLSIYIHIYILVFCLGAARVFCDERDDENDALLFAKSLSTRICDGKFSLHVVGGIFFFVFIGDESSSFSKATRDESRKNGGRSNAACCSFFIVHRDCLSRGF